MYDLARAYVPDFDRQKPVSLLSSARWRLITPLLAGLSMALAGCSDVEEEAPTVGLLTPEEGATVCGTSLAVELEVTNFELEEPGEHARARVAPSHEEGESSGHIDLSLDGQVVAMEGTTETTLEGTIPDGEHTLTAVLVDEEHQPIEPATEDSVTFTVDSSLCGGG